MGGGFGGGHMGGFGGPHMGGPAIGGPRTSGPMHFAPRGERFANHPRFRDRHFRRDHRRVFFFGDGDGYYDYGYGYGYGCYWLRQNAFATGSPYWWRRYNACVYGY
jgi:hypothetical protein